MANTNFDLDGAISTYISGLNTNGSLTSSDQAELTTHILDATEDLQRTGLTADEAFTIAVKRMGNGQLLADEFGKVNPALKTNKIWAYLLSGFNLFYTIPIFIHRLLAIIYYVCYRNFGVSVQTTTIATTAHLLICAGIVYFVIKKHSVAKYLENQLQKNSIRFILVSFAIFGLLTISNFIVINPTQAKFNSYGGSLLAQVLGSTLIEYSYYLILFSIAGGGLALVFSLNNPGRITLASILQKPSTLFLILAGLFIETLAASTRMISTDNILIKAIAFGAVYLLASTLIAYFNKYKTGLILLKFGLLGLIIEATVHISSHASRSGTIFTVYFVTALFTGILMGWFIGARALYKTQAILV